MIKIIKTKLIGFVVTVVIIVAISQIGNITLLSKSGGIFLVPVLYFLTTYVIPHMVKDYIATWKDIIADKEVCFTKDAYLTRNFEEATGEEVEEIEKVVEGEEVND